MRNNGWYFNLTCFQNSKPINQLVSEPNVSILMEFWESVWKFFLFYSCPFFRNEIGGETDRNISISASSGLSVQVNHMLIVVDMCTCFFPWVNILSLFRTYSYSIFLYTARCLLCLQTIFFCPDHRRDRFLS